MLYKYVIMLCKFKACGCGYVDVKLYRQVVNRGYSGVNPRDVGAEYCRPSHHFGPAVRQYLLLHYVVSGSGRFTVAGRQYELSASDVFIIRPHEVTFYQASKTDPWHYIWLGFEVDSKEIFSCFTRKDVIKKSNFGDIFASLLEFKDDGPAFESFLCSKIWEIISRLQQSGPKPSSGYTEKATAIIETEYMHGITVGDIAGRLNLDRSYFSTLFKAEKGISPQQYICELRLKKAAELIKNHGCSVTVAANSTGYTDIFNFSKMFKKRYGVSPAAYRAKARGKK